MKKKNGFTLVELLAVIVVLAIIMIIAVPSVLTSMETAKKNSLKIYAQRVIQKAMEEYQATLLTGDTPATCYTIANLKLESGGKYTGVAVYDSTNNVFKVYLADGQYYVNGNTFSELGDPSKVLTGAKSNLSKSTC